MKLAKLKIYFIRQLIKPVVGFFIACVLMAGSLYLEGSYRKQYSLIKQQNEALRQKILDINNNIVEEQKTRITWEKIRDKNFGKRGLRVEELKQIIENIRKNNNINELTINLSNPVLRKDTNTSVIGLEYSELTITCNAYTDKYIFEFLNQLLKQVPGLIVCTSFNIRSLVSVIDSSVLQSIKQGGYKDLVQAKLIFIWQDFVNLKE